MTYVAAITAILARYPEHVITTVTHPATGLPKKINWLPTIKEVGDACDEAGRLSAQNEERLERIKKQMEARDRDDQPREARLTLEELKAKYPPNWGLDVDPSINSKPPIKAPSWDSLAAHYQADPSRLANLLKRDE